jgi:cytochrome c oxidase subunit 2
MKNRTASIGVVVISILMLIAMGAMMAYFGWMPEAMSNLAPVVDAPFYFVIATSAILTVGVVLVMLRLVVKYLRKEEHENSTPVEPSPLLELSWVVLPTILVLIVFTWGFKAFMTVTQPPDNAYEIRVYARKWAWEFEYPTGFRTTNELYVPSNRPVKLVMTSTDVLHSFWVPNFRVKHDVIPNRYSSVWFEATHETPIPASVGDPDATGFIPILCTEYCGTGHSAMGAKLWVLPQDRYDEFLAGAGGATDDMPLPELGELLYTQKACNGCHSIDGAPGVGPTLLGLFGKEETMTDGTRLVADENYLRESILVPAAKVVEGYQPIMPPIPLTDREVDGLIEYIKTLQ